METFTLEKNSFLRHDVAGYFSLDFYGLKHPENPNFLYTFKNDGRKEWMRKLFEKDREKLRSILEKDIQKITQDIKTSPLTICVVPRAKSEDFYHPDQLQFRDVVQKYAQSMRNFIDGTHFIIRHTNTKTTHLPRNPIEGFFNDGRPPYPGIANDTCHFSDQIKGSDILLIDDIYTKTVNIDEDMAQALFDKGARSVIFYAVARTVPPEAKARFK